MIKLALLLIALLIIPVYANGFDCVASLNYTGPVCATNGITYSDQATANAAGAYVFACQTCSSSYASDYTACAENQSTYGNSNTSYMERYISCSMGTLVGNGSNGNSLLAIIVAAFFMVFVMFQNTRLEGKIVVLIPVAFLITIWVGWFIYFLGMFIGFFVYLGLAKILGK